MECSGWRCLIRLDLRHFTFPTHVLRNDSSKDLYFFSGFRTLLLIASFPGFTTIDNSCFCLDALAFFSNQHLGDLHWNECTRSLGLPLTRSHGTNIESTLFPTHITVHPILPLPGQSKKKRKRLGAGAVFRSTSHHSTLHHDSHTKK